MYEGTAGHPDQRFAELAARFQQALGAEYAVENPLGAGGFAVVFKVRDLRLKRSLAIKVLSPELTASREVRERFRREAESIAKLSHPNIVPLHFIGDTDDLLYLAMQCVDGGSLAELLQREGQLPVEVVTRLVIEVAGALGHAHRRGVVHRDIKPQNVLLDAESGRALVTDFGIARSADAASSLTATGVVLGTPAYVSPEQIAGEPSDHRADIYALGVMAYELLAGQVPFSGKSPTAILASRFAGPPRPIATLRPDVPPAVQRVLEGCLAIDPAKRFQNADDVISALAAVAPASAGPDRSGVVMPSVRRRWTIGAATVGLVVLVVVSFFALRNPQRSVAAFVAGTQVAGAIDDGMALIPAGEHIIGADTGPVDAPHRPAHQVHVDAFAIDRREVTVAEFSVYADSTHIDAPWRGGTTPNADLPVTRVGFDAAGRYCRWKHPVGGRLPTELEWEAAARGAAGRSYPWGEAAAAGRANTASAGVGEPSRVDSFADGATPEGIVGLIGNVWEWTDSEMRPYPNGPARSAAPGDFRVIRGGAFNTPDSLATPWKRVPVPRLTAPATLDATGFRCAATPHVRAEAKGGR